MILSSLTFRTSILPHVGGAEAVQLQPGAERWQAGRCGAAADSVDVPGQRGSQSPCADLLWFSGHLWQSAGTNQRVGKLCRTRGIKWGVGAAAECDGVVLLVVSHTALVVRNQPWDGAVSACLGREGWAPVCPHRALHPPGCRDSWLLRREWEDLFFSCICCGKRLFSST